MSSQSPALPRAARVARPALAALILAGVACSTEPVSGPVESPDPDRPSFTISDGAHGGSTRVYFLQPLVAQPPSFSGTFDPSRFGAGSGDEIYICVLAGPACGTRIVTFGPGAVMLQNQAYKADWTPATGTLDLSQIYRIVVALGGQVAAYADVRIVEKAADKRGIDPSQYVVMDEGTPQNIRVRVEVVTTSIPVVAAIEAGLIHTCMLLTTGAAYCFGDNSLGQLGDGTTTGRLSPVAVTGGLTFRKISTADVHTCGLTTAGAAWCWGYNIHGQLGTGTVSGAESSPVPVSGGHVFEDISTGQALTCARTAGGVVYCWGMNGYGQLGNGTVGADVPTPVQVAGVYTTVSAGGNHACALDAGGTAWCWGATFSPSPTPVTGGLTFTSIVAGVFHTCAIQAVTGQGWCWGHNPQGALGDGTQTDSSSPVAVSGGLVFASIDAYYTHTCGVTTAGAAYCWGYNATGQLGDPNATDPTLTPNPVTGGVTFGKVSTSANHTCGVSTAGAALCWGDNRFGQLGNGTTLDQASPGAVLPPP